MDDWMRKSIPSLWHEDNPNKHKLTVFGQQRPDGWHCWGCSWMTMDSSMTKEQARNEHGEIKENEEWAN